MFEDDKLNGKGKITFEDGIIHEGEFKDNMLHGKGKITWTNGTVWEGEFKDGESLNSNTTFFKKIGLWLTGKFSKN